MKQCDIEGTKLGDHPLAVPLKSVRVTSSDGRVTALMQNVTHEYCDKKMYVWFAVNPETSEGVKHVFERHSIFQIEKS